ncbi:cytochrome P450 [Corynebacterium mastitidis]|uniref:Cytochrome P450, cyclodipeptide synthase-associated n=1 Tax=Corynebacterium mastitidis TaxID=161890 RepID=A0A2N0X774_9CORY|nr:cytochrome P450 [Corynebacterium mastitidis]MCH6197587.1 cytochrome P450 [Corynebacterium mastitidis]PKF68555.1 cytochrome P450, cyclodipeptide synthase-associated [Corynebacterium mastitidis]
MFDPHPPTLLSESALDNPYPIYQRMRETGPVYHDEIAGAWCILSYDLIRRILHDSDNFSSKHLDDRAEPALGARVLAQMHGPEHDTKKAIVMRGIATIAMDGYYLPTIEHIVHDLWERAERKNNLDLVHELSSPFSSDVTCKLLGIEPQWKSLILPWNRSVVEFITLLNQTPNERSQRLADAGYFRAFILRMIEARRRSPKHDFISYLALSGSDSGLADDEIVALALNIFLAASEPLDKTLSYLIYEVLRSPELEKSILNDETIIGAALAETLRLHPPVHIIPRIAMGKQNIAGKNIPDGGTVYCLIGAAHRDPEHFINPNEFILSRKENPQRKAFSPSAQHLAFGSGLHFCIGSMLAKRQIEAAFRASLPYMSRWRLTNSPLIEHGLYTRGPSHLFLERRH